VSRHFWIPFASTALCLAIVVPWIAQAAGGRRGFDGVVSDLEHEYHVHATRIPFMALASLVAGQATHGGVASVRIAEFEQFDKPADGDSLARITENNLGPSWEQMIRSTSRHGGEQTLIFAHPDGSHMGLFILDLDGHELDVVQVSVDPSRLTETIAKYNHHDGRGGSEAD
jgi:hypothetical protein